MVAVIAALFGLTPVAKAFGRRVVDHVHGRFGQAGADRHLLDDVMELLVLVRIGGMRARHREHEATARRQRVDGGASREDCRNGDTGEDGRAPRARATAEDGTQQRPDAHPDQNEQRDDHHTSALVPGDLFDHGQNDRARTGGRLFNADRFRARG